MILHNINYYILFYAIDMYRSNNSLNSDDAEHYELHEDESDAGIKDNFAQKTQKVCTLSFIILFYIFKYILFFNTTVPTGYCIRKVEKCY